MYSVQKQCKFDAIEGELKEKHKVDADKCVGCHLCMENVQRKLLKFCNMDKIRIWNNFHISNEYIKQRYGIISIPLFYVYLF